ncbi:hypothetical protein BDV95DRAFT_602061 [Massariosphaeria phaeospora]|uniref:Rhodopsin domain-containing protein n=1 Tax=Massariosphaeria phaeospora TaxID=100035 RepID=A0A7C8IEL3_9PLEO|nr:hypothetical protein BDV95DRAFT_602061 [Massariosphaeria phaeospora]
MRIRPEGPPVTLLVVQSIVIALTTITTILRVFIRVKTRAFGLDDYLMVFAYVVSIAVGVFTLIFINYGSGVLASNTTKYDVAQSKKWNLFAGIGYAVATAFIKLSICVMLIRITPRTKRSILYTIYGVMLLACCGALARTITFTTRCKPMSAAWDLSLGTCSSAVILTNVSYFFAAVCILTDLICATIPIFIIWDVQLSVRNKTYIGMIMALGILASVATCIRIKYLVGYASQTKYLFGLSYIATWSEVEICLGIIAGSLPVMRPLLRYLHPGSTQGGQRTQQEIYRLKGSGGWKRSTSRHVPGNTNGRSDGAGAERMGNSFYVGTSSKEEVEAGDTEDASSQRHILTEARLEVFKETQYEVKSERDIGSLDSPNQV